MAVHRYRGSDHLNELEHIYHVNHHVYVDHFDEHARCDDHIDHRVLAFHNDGGRLSNEHQFVRAHDEPSYHDEPDGIS